MKFIPRIIAMVFSVVRVLHGSALGPSNLAEIAANLITSLRLLVVGKEVEVYQLSVLELIVALLESSKHILFVYYNITLLNTCECKTKSVVSTMYEFSKKISPFSDR